ncbi:MAG: peptide chain release factor N(5)-glutamine methyltransferase [Chitinophagaceae bacterium]
MKSNEAEQFIRSALQDIYEAGEASNIAAMVVEHLSGKSRSERMLDAVAFSLEQEQSLNHYLQRLKQHEPVQYVLGESWFAGMQLFVDKNVLIPRPETEELVQWIIDDVKKEKPYVFERKIFEADQTHQLKIIDIGTGSGCIALALKKAMPVAEVWGCDVSEEALNVARRNGSTLNIRVDFQNANFLDVAQQKHLPSLDIVVSNPPYIPQKDKTSIQANVLNYEPHIALFVPDNDALVFYKALIEFGKHRLHKGGKIYMEIHEDLAKDVVSLFEGEHYSVIVRKDMQGKDRMVRAISNY